MLPSANAPGRTVKMEEALHKAVLRGLDSFFGNAVAIWRRLDMQVENYWELKRERSKNPLVKNGAKYFSQNDEDGMTLEIVRRIGTKNGIALEFGVGDGLENNSIILLLAGWKVLWIGGEDIKLTLPHNCKNLAFTRSWVTKENCIALAVALLQRFGVSDVDFLSIDLDGNDIYILEEVLKYGLRPSIICVEYNGKFPPPIRWQIEYNPSFNWDFSDYQGASIQSFIDLTERYSYFLVGCNITGVNAYFVRSELKPHFPDVPQNLQDIFVPPDYNWFIRRGHYTSKKTIERALTSAGL